MSSLRSQSCSTRSKALALSALALAACAERALVDGASFYVVGETVKPRCGEPPDAPSAIYDGVEVRLRGARGETLALQVVPGRDDAAPVSLRFDDRVVEVASFGVHCVTVREPSTAMYGPSRGAGSYPDVLVPVTGDVDGADGALFDIAISREAPAGVYRGTLSVGAARVPVSVRVEPLTIDVGADPRVWVYYEPREIARAHGVANGTPEQWRWERRYARLFRAHGAYLSTDLDRDAFARRRRLLSGVRYWPVLLDTGSAAAVAEDVRAWVERFEGLPAIPFAIPVDEPRRMRERLRVREIGRAIDRAVTRPDQFLLAVTDGPSPLYGDAVDVFISPSAPPAERRWTYNGRPPQAGSMIIDTDGAALRTWGWIGYRYDVELWYAWEGLYFSDRYNDGAATELSEDPLTFDQRGAGGEDYGNGDGLLAYPGALPSLRLKALRRGLQDRKLLELLAACGGAVEADVLAQRAVPVALAEAAGGAPRWPATEREWARARAAVLDAAVRRCGDVL